MKFRTLAAAAAALSFTAAPVAAQAAPQRAAAPTEEGSEMGGSGWILGVLALAAFIAAIIVATGNEDDAVSP
ncbi:hypothetical protein ACWPM1_04835 [Tsuneonella sp. HG249]